MQINNTIQRIKHGYYHLALLTINTCLLILLVNIILFQFYQWKDRDEIARGQFTEQNLSWLDKVYPELNRQQIITMVTEKISRPFVVDQLAKWREAPYHGTYVNVDENGFRKSKDRAAWPPDNDNSFVIFLFGGSTTFGYGVEDSQTISSHLQGLIEKAGSEKLPVIYNFGQGNYYSTQELVLLVRLITLGFTPDMAIFIDGLNEFFLPPVSLSKVQRRHESTSHYLRELVQKLPMTRAAESIRSRITQAAQSIRNRVSENKSLPNSLESRAMQASRDTLINDVISRYLATKQMIEAVTESYGIETLFVWQPVPTYKYDTQHHYPLLLKGFGRLGITKHGYEMMSHVKRSSNFGKEFIWCADIQQDVAEPLYVDMWHYTGKMNGMVAKCIYDHIRIN